MDTQLLVNNENPLLSAIGEIDNALELGKQGLLKMEELQEIYSRSKDRVENELVENSLLWREYDKRKRSTTYWSVVPKGGYSPIQDVEGKLQPLREYAIRILEEQGKQPAKKQHFIDKGQVASGRKLLRVILATAKVEISIQDNYVHGKSNDIDILYILQPYLEENPALKVRILTTGVSNPFKSDFSLFNQQYGNRLELKLHNNAHDRYIIIDNKDVYHFGASIKDLGNKATQVSLVTEVQEKDKVLTAFHGWFTSGTST